MHLPFACQVNGLWSVAHHVAVAHVNEVHAHETKSSVCHLGLASNVILEQQVHCVAPVGMESQKVVSGDLVRAIWKPALQLAPNLVQVRNDVELLSQRVQQAIVACAASHPHGIATVFHDNVGTFSSNLHLEHVRHVIAEFCVGVIFAFPVEERAGRQIGAAAQAIASTAARGGRPL